MTRDQEVDPGTRKPVSFTVKETVCPRTTQQPPEECDFKENGVRLGAGWGGKGMADASPGLDSGLGDDFQLLGGGREVMAQGVPLTLSLPLQLVKQCVGTVTLDPSNDQFDINCNEVSGPFWTQGVLGGVSM